MRNLAYLVLMRVKLKRNKVKAKIEGLKDIFHIGHENVVVM